MAFSASTAQTRELTELRNHLKWLDEERRKSARKLGELEQRFAQQGRDLSEREQRIQELEWQLNNLSERLDRLPQDNNETTALEQRIQDLEWHLSNVNAQLVRLPKVDEELASFKNEFAQLIEEQRERQRQVESELQQRLAAEQEDLDYNIRQLDERLQIQERLESELQAQRAANEEIVRQVSELREQFPDSLAHLERELVARVDAESHTLTNSLSTLSSSFAQLEQQFLFRQAADNQFEEQLEEVRSSLSRVVFIEQDLTNIAARVDEQMAQTSSRVEEEANQLIQNLTADINEQMQSVAMRVEEIQRSIPPDVREAMSGLEQQLAEVRQANVTVEQQLTEVRQANANVEQRLAEVKESVPPDVQDALLVLEQRIEDVRQLIPADMQPMLADLTAEIEQRLDAVQQSIPLDIQQIVSRLEQEIELRQAEEVRLLNLIGVQEGKLTPLAEQVDSLHEMLEVTEERIGRNSEVSEQLQLRLQEFDETIKPQVMGISEQLGQAAERLGILSNSTARLEASVKSLSEEQTELRTQANALAEQVSRGDKEVERQLDTWRTTLDEQKDTIDRFAQQWTILSNQYKEARMAVQNFAHWQKQLEQQRRESSEMLRVESNRMQSRWDGLLLEINERLKNFEIELEQKWKNFEVDAEQKWSAVRRSEQQWREELASIDELLVKMQQDNRNLIWRVQAAQADAIKKWPRLWLEEVEKAVELNPNRRLPASTGAPLRADMSVIDALEQGLIKIDYEDEFDQSMEQ